MQQPQPHCNGSNVSDGLPCRRNQKLNPNGFCYQHLKQDPSYNEAEAMPRTPAPFAMSQQQQRLQQQEANEERRSMSSSSSGVGPSNASNNNSNNEEVERSHTSGGGDLSSAFSASASASGSALAAVAAAGSQKGDLPRCTAIAKSTGQVCCKRVSLAGEVLCPRHGGRQIKLASMLPMCSAISKSTRQPCLNHVTTPGNVFCTIHTTPTALARSPLLAMYQLPQPRQPQPALSSSAMKPEPEEYENPRGWANMQLQCIRFLMHTHPQSACPCSTSAEPCQKMRLVMWAQGMIQLAQ